MMMRIFVILMTLAMTFGSEIISMWLKNIRFVVIIIRLFGIFFFILYIWNNIATKNLLRITTRTLFWNTLIFSQNYWYIIFVDVIVL